ncbi:MAG: hypothetical protein Rhirs2KO_34660 [Rhizobiaceae bacterium]
MGDEVSNIGQNNVRGLVQDVSELFDAMANELRSKTVFANTRPADAKTFMLISRHPRGLTELANALEISRQAAHKSVQRLVEAGVVSFDYAPNSKRDMVAELTEKGLEARKVGLGIAAEVERFVCEAVGDKDLEALRRILLKVLDRAKSI